MPDVFLSHSPFHFVEQALSLYLELTNSSRLASSEQQGSSYLSPQSWYYMCPIALSFLCRCWDPNSSPYACTTTTLLNELSPKPCPKEHNEWYFKTL